MIIASLSHSSDSGSDNSLIAEQLNHGLLVVGVAQHNNGEMNGRTKASDSGLENGVPQGPLLPNTPLPNKVPPNS